MATLKGDSIKSAGQTVKADRAYYVNADRSALADEGSEDAAFLLAAKGGEVSAKDAERFGITGMSEEDAKALEGVDNTAQSPDIDADGRAEGGPEGDNKALEAPPKTATKAKKGAGKKGRK